MIVDSSVWIDVLRQRNTRAVQYLQTALVARARVCLTPTILQEVLQGSRSVQQFEKLHRRLDSLEIVGPADWAAASVAAARMYMNARLAGITPRSHSDCLIVVVAIELDLPLLHDDRDFTLLQTVDPRLRSVI